MATCGPLCSPASHLYVGHGDAVRVHGVPCRRREQLRGCAGDHADGGGGGVAQRVRLAGAWEDKTVGGRRLGRQIYSSKCRTLKETV